MSTSSTSLPATKASGLSSLYRHFCAAAHLLRSPFLLFVRLYWGWQFMQTGWGKLHNLSHVTQFFSASAFLRPV